MHFNRTTPIPIRQDGPGGSMSQVVGSPNNTYKPITNTAWVRAGLCKLQKGCTRLAAANDTVYQLLAHGRWFSPGTPASSITKAGRHDIAEILLKVALNTINQIKSIFRITQELHMYNWSWQTMVILYHLQRFVILIASSFKMTILCKYLFVVTASGILEILIVTRLLDTRIKTFEIKRLMLNSVLLDDHILLPTIRSIDFVHKTI